MAYGSREVVFHQGDEASLSRHRKQRMKLEVGKARSHPPVACILLPGPKPPMPPKEFY